MDIPGVLGTNASVVAAAMVVVWLISLARRDASIIDPLWGTGFVIVALTSWTLADGDPARRALVAAMVTVWGLRLSIHLLVRNLRTGEDARYAAMRERHGSRWPVVSLFQVFGLQGVLLWVVSVPVQVSMASEVPRGLTVTDLLGLAVWLVGFVFETVGDAQLARFKADPANEGRVMDQGLWRYTRHPNYFGDFCVWWGIWLVAAPTSWGWATVVGPLVMSFLLTRVSGVPLLEKVIRRSRPGYEEYVRRTSAFFPRPPKRA